MFQSYALFPNMNVYENISVGLRARKVKRCGYCGSKSDETISN